MGRLIDEDEFIDNCANEISNSTPLRGIIANALDKTHSVNTWIPYDKQKPLKPGPYLITDIHGFILLLEYDDTYDDPNYLWTYDGGCSISPDLIKAYMPLPEPYMEEEE